MSEPALDAERIAAFLDGRLPESEREVVMAQLAASPEWQEIAVDAAALRTANDAVAPARAGRALRFGNNRGMLLAAAASIAVFATLWSAGKSDVGADSPAITPLHAVTLVIASHDLSALSSERWVVVRSGNNEVDETARAVRLGVLSVDAVLDRAGDGAGAREEMLVLMRPLNASVASQLVLSARDSASYDGAFTSVRALVSSDAFDVGVWLELLRAGSSTAQANTDMIAALQRVLQTKQLSPERAEELTAHIRRLSDVLPTGELVNARAAATDVLKILAS